jgi:hypothetical protein
MPDIIKCPVCHSLFERRTHGKRPASKFCSPKCGGIGRRKPVTIEFLAERFWMSVDKRGPDECWNWTLTPGNPGYGIVTIGAHFKRAAHRVSYELHFGPIPKGDGAHGTCVCHRCDNRLCVNPAHLFLGTQAENLQDGWRKGRITGHPLSADQARRMRMGLKRHPHQ